MAEARMETESSNLSAASEDVIAARGGVKPSYAASALHVPHRMEQVLISWLFNLASVALIMDFVALQDLLRDPVHPDGLAELCNWFGVVSCVLWFLGFAALAHWLHCVGATRLALFGCYMKLLASIFFNIQPMTGTMNDPRFAGGFPRGGGAGTWWSNLTGILLFHGGNLVSSLDFFLHTPPGADKDKGWFFHGNLPITGMWTYQAATWLLTAANALACTFGGGASWAPLLPMKSLPVVVCQMAGGFLLLAGSVIFTVWCDGFRNFGYGDAPPKAGKAAPAADGNAAMAA